MKKCKNEWIKMHARICGRKEYVLLADVCWGEICVSSKKRPSLTRKVVILVACRGFVTLGGKGLKRHKETFTVPSLFNVSQT